MHRKELKFLDLGQDINKAFVDKLRSMMTTYCTKGSDAVTSAPLEPVLDRDCSVMGEVFLVGAGPGAPDLITLRAYRLMQLADVVLYDNLVAEEIVAQVNPAAQRIYVGKKSSRHTLPQDEINSALVKLAQSGKKVLRLKGGDPFIFGRGGEEVETLKAHGVPFQIVPGVSAANGISCYTGIPLTHRDYAHAVTFVTGHLKNGTSDLDWPALVRPSHTVVIYMGLEALPEISRQLMAHGLPANHPIAVIHKGTTTSQKICVGTLETITEQVRTAGLTPPSLIIAGEVVLLHDKLNWFCDALHSANRSVASGRE